MSDHDASERAITIGRNDTLDQKFRGMELKLADLAELRSLPDVRKSLDMIRPGDVIQLTHLDGEIKSLTRRIDDARFNPNGGRRCYTIRGWRCPPPTLAKPRNGAP